MRGRSLQRLGDCLFLLFTGTCIEDLWQISSSQNEGQSAPKASERSVKFVQQPAVIVPKHLGIYRRLTVLVLRLRPQLPKLLMFYHTKNSGEVRVLKTFFHLSPVSSVRLLEDTRLLV